MKHKTYTNTKNASVRKKLLTGLLLILGLIACSGQNAPTETTTSLETTAALLAHLEANGNLINGPLIPALVEPETVFEHLQNPGMLVIDVRPEEAFREGHIEFAVNVPPPAILDYFEYCIDPNSFELIVLVCSSGFMGGYVNAVLLLLGYHNVVNMRYGLSSWDEDIAARFWLDALGNEMLGRLDTRTYPMPPPGELPAISGPAQVPAQLLRERARQVLNVSVADVQLPFHALADAAETPYLVSYWPAERYGQGHLPGSVRYEPKFSLHSSTHIHTLPPDRPMVVYCYSGHHSTYVTAFLRLLGYDAYNMPYGANAFAHNMMLTQEGFFRTFTPEYVRGFPLVRPGTGTAPAPLQTGPERPPVPAAGGC